jgi:hypothetical protein
MAMKLRYRPLRPNFWGEAAFRNAGLDGHFEGDSDMGRGILLWLLGVPIPIIILLALFWH